MELEAFKLQLGLVKSLLFPLCWSPVTLVVMMASSWWPWCPGGCGRLGRRGALSLYVCIRIYMSVFWVALSLLPGERGG